MSELHAASDSKITSAFESISEDVRSFYSGLSIVYLENPDAFTFLQQVVSQHRPCILTGMLESWPALHKWQDLEYLIAEMDKDDSNYVNFTPNGRADSVHSHSFVTPAEIKMSARTFFDMLQDSKSKDAVPYLSRQDDNFRRNFPSLLKDIEQSIPLATKVFGDDRGIDSDPEAINLWIGDERSVSSLHKDFFENFYCVIKGTKTFLLYPPCDAIYFETKEYPLKSYVLKEEKAGDGSARKQHVKQDDLELKDIHPTQTTRWISIDPEEEGIESKYPQLKHTSPLRVEVKAGEILYIPAMWLHRVGQTELTVAINFWHDMRFDNRYVFHRLVQALQEQQEL